MIKFIRVLFTGVVYFVSVGFENLGDSHKVGIKICSVRLSFESKGKLWKGCYLSLLNIEYFQKDIRCFIS